MKPFEFELKITDPGIDFEEAACKFMDASEQDMSYGTRHGSHFVSVYAEAECLYDAIRAAIADIESTALCRVTRVLPEDLVFQADIARRCGDIPRQTVALWARGERRDGFPEAETEVGGKPLYSWRTVSRWLVANKLAGPEVLEYAEIIKDFNKKLVSAA